MKKEEEVFAKIKASEFHFEGEWIDRLSQEDCADILRIVWLIITKDTDTANEKYFNIRHMVERIAIKKSEEYANENWGDFIYETG
jgi:hypothetical protein